MPSIVRREKDPLKEYGWLAIAGVVFIGIWLALPNMGGTGSDAVEIGGSPLSANEQSLSSLDPISNPQGAPGEALRMPSSGGSYAGKGESTQSSSLYRAPEGAGAAAAAASEPGEAPAKNDELAQAMAKVASAGKAPDNGWGGKAARSGFSRPKAKFGKVGSTRGGGKGSTSAQLTVKKAFGTGGDPGLSLSARGGLAGGAPGSGRRRIDASGRGNGTLSDLKKAQKANLDALKGNDELAAGGGRQTFDVSGKRSSAMSALQSAGGAVGLSGDDAVPMNLKATDPKKINKREFEPPEIKDGGEVKDSDNQQYMQQQMMMMMMQMALSGIMGPMGGMVGGMMTMAMTSNAPPPG